jgi:DNA-damage-inducible protein J
MAKTETVRARVDPKLKADAEAVLNKLGLTTSGAIRLFYRQLAALKKLTFDEKIPNAETRRAIKDIEEGRGLTTYKDFDEFRKAMFGQ